MKKIILIISCLLPAAVGWTQGCVAIRNIEGVNPNLLFKNVQPTDKWILSINNRYFEASKTYKGDKYISDTLVRNKIFTLDISLLRILPKGWSIVLDAPIAANSRRNSNDHGGPKTPKHSTESFGFGDLRLTAYKWLLNTSTSKRGNIQLGLGVKLPTGDYRYEDYFYRSDSIKVVAPVDQAIQLGDGGTGITTELNAYYTVARSFTLYLQGYYLINPREQNGVSNLKGRNATPVEIANNTTVMSVPDQYNIRAGGNYEWKKLALAANIRYEKVPVNDLMGGNKGFRRAASITSIETAVTYSMNKTIVFINVGVPIHCDIIQNAQNNMTPAGFARLITSFGVSFKM